MNPITIWVLEDDGPLRKLVLSYLREQVGFTALGFDTVAALNARLEVDAPPDLLLLDLTLPDQDGLDFLDDLRASQQTFPVMILSARGRDEDRIRGLRSGADDYLVKPFHPEELVARIHAILRRTRTSIEPIADDTLFHFGPFTLDMDAWVLREGDHPVEMTAGEMRLLRVFAQHPNRVLSRAQLMDLLGEENQESFERSIDIRVTRLRKHLHEQRGHTRYIHTIRGEGYRFSPEPESD
jgi:two-component system phosphate regulon response regulator OmpR